MLIDQGQELRHDCRLWKLERERKGSRVRQGDRERRTEGEREKSGERRGMLVKSLERTYDIEIKNLPWLPYTESNLHTD